jgi:hypothetical protein
VSLKIYITFSLAETMNDSMKKEMPGPGETYGDVGDILLSGVGIEGSTVTPSVALRFFHPWD